MLNEIFEEVARKRNLPVEQVKLIYNSYMLGIRYYLSNPLISKGTIRIPFIGAFKITRRSANAGKTQEEKNLLQDYRKQYERKKSKRKENA